MKKTKDPELSAEVLCVYKERKGKNNFYLPTLV